MKWSSGRKAPCQILDHAAEIDWSSQGILSQITQLPACIAVINSVIESGTIDICFSSNCRRARSRLICPL
jgi:hypothetical protein